jgi:serine/threonine protein phosphatase 1
MIKSLLKRFAKPSGSDQVVAPRLPDGVRIYAFGDVHGRVDLLEQLYGQVRKDLEDRPVDKAMEVFLGDYVDRGPCSKEVIDWLVTGQDVADKRICLRGNHELMMQAFLDDASVIRSWGQYGGLETLHSYGLKFKLPITDDAHDEIQAQFSNALPAEHLEFLRVLRPSASAGGYFFAHAGVNPTKPMNQQVEDDLYWIRDPFLDWGRPLEKIVVHGHTPVEEPEVEVHRIGVDTGAYVTGRLTCGVLEGNEVRFLST